MMNLNVINTPCLKPEVHLDIGSRELWMPRRRQVGVHDFQSPPGICSNWREDSKSQFYSADSVRPTLDFMQPSLY